jgi:phage terminase large subunit
MTYRDNPWFPDELRHEMLELKARNYDQYMHVWEGECLQVLEGVIFADELREAQSQGRITSVPYDKSLPVNAVFDLGRSDHTSCWFVQKAGLEWHIIDFYQNRLKIWDHYLGVLQGRGYTYDTVFLPHDAKAKMLGTRMSIEEQTRAKFQNVVILPRVSPTDKINAGRTVFHQCYFDQRKCAEGIHSLKHWHFEIDPTSGRFGLNPVHDEHSDAADAFCYFGMASSRKTKGSRRGFFGSLMPRGVTSEPEFSPWEVGGGQSDANGWMR